MIRPTNSWFWPWNLFFLVRLLKPISIPSAQWYGGNISIYHHTIGQRVCNCWELSLKTLFVSLLFGSAEGWAVSAAHVAHVMLIMQVEIPWKVWFGNVTITERGWKFRLRKLELYSYYSVTHILHIGQSTRDGHKILEVKRLRQSRQFKHVKFLQHVFVLKFFSRNWFGICIRDGP